MNNNRIEVRSAGTILSQLAFKAKHFVEEMRRQKGRERKFLVCSSQTISACSRPRTQGITQAPSLTHNRYPIPAQSDIRKQPDSQATHCWREKCRGSICWQRHQSPAHCQLISLLPTQGTLCLWETAHNGYLQIGPCSPPPNLTVSLPLPFMHKVHASVSQWTNNFWELNIYINLKNPTKEHTLTSTSSCKLKDLLTRISLRWEVGLQWAAIQSWPCANKHAWTWCSFSHCS